MALQDVLAELAVNLRLDTAAYSAGVSKAEAQTSRLERRLQGFQKSAGAIGRTMASLAGGLAGGFAAGFGVDAIVRATQAALEYAGSLGETAQQLGVTTRDLQVFRFAAGQVGVSQDQLETGLSKLTITLGKVAAGAKEPVKAFNAIGISADQLKGKDAGEAFRLIADHLERVTDRAQRAAIEVALFGKSGASLDNLLSGGSKALNDLATAADKLGIVLSDEQIRNADATADKLEALKTVLSARIAGVVADNAGAINDLADAFGRIASLAGGAISGIAGVAQAIASLPTPPDWWLAALRGVTPAIGAAVEARARIQEAQKADKQRTARGTFPGGASVGSSVGSITVALPPISSSKFKLPSQDIGDFLASGGGRKKADHSAEEAMRKRLEALSRAHEYDERELRAQEEILSAQQSIAHDYVDRTAIAVQVADLDRKIYKSQLDFEVEQFKISKGAQGISQAQADSLLALYDRKDALERQALLEEEETNRQQDYNRLEAVSFEIQRNKLQAESSLAETAAERRAIELKIIELAYREQRERLQRIIKESKDWAEIEEARRQLAALPNQQALDTQNALKNTRGPGEDFLASLPTSAAKANEALQKVAVEGLRSVEQGILDVITGARSMRDVFHQIAEQILADLLRLAIEKYVMGTLANALFGGGSGDIGSSFLFSASPRASGGPVYSGATYLVGEKGPELFVPNSSGRIVSNDNMGMGARVSLTNYNDFRGADPTAVAAISARIDRMEADLPLRVVRSVKDARERFVLR
jgi:hypothetical protein